MSTVLLRLKHLSARNLAIGSIALSGAVHLLIVPEQLSHSVAHGSFFAFIGVAQVLWALYFRWRPAAPLYWAGVLLSGGIVITWLLAFFVSTPYSAHVEPFDASLMASKILELIGLLALITHGAAGAVATTDRSSTSRLVANSLVASVIFGSMVWGGGELAELLLSGSEDGHSLGSDQSHAEGHRVDLEGGETLHLESVPANPADIQAITNAAVEAALVALETNNASADSAKSLSPALPSDIQAMVAVAVESAFSPDIIPTPSPGLLTDIQAPDVESPDLQAMVAAAVEAALNPDPALIPTPGPLPVHQGMVTAAVEANLVQHESEHLQVVGHGDSPAEESVPIPLPDRPDPVTTLPRPLLVGSTAAPAPIAQPPQRNESYVPLAPVEEEMDLKMVLFGAALVALTLIAVVGAVRTWNDII